MNGYMAVALTFVVEKSSSENQESAIQDPAFKSVFSVVDIQYLVYDDVPVGIEHRCDVGLEFIHYRAVDYVFWKGVPLIKHPIIEKKIYSISKLEYSLVKEIENHNVENGPLVEV